MIESEEKKKRLKDAIGHWCKYVKIEHLLRDGDVSSLVRTILEEFYRVHLCCGHMVYTTSDGIPLAFKESDGSEVQGIYCKDCAEIYKKKLGAWEIK